MDIILDTNILRKDFKLSSKLFEALFSFLNKTDSHIILPEIVFEEAVSLYEREYSKTLRLLKNTQSDLNKISFTNHQTDFIEYNILKEVEAYKKKLLSPGTDNTVEIIKNDDAHLMEATKRLLKAEKPASEKRNEYRDVLIWLSIRDYINAIKYTTTLVFISANVKDFADSNFKDLHPFLMNEIKSNITLLYYPSLESFLKSKADKIDFINTEWLENKIKTKDLDKLIENKIGKYDYKLETYLEKNHENFNGQYEFEGVDYSIDEFFIIEIEDDYTYVNITLACVLYLNFEEEYRDEWGANLFKNQYKSVDIEILVFLSATIIDNEINEIEFDDWQLL